MTISSFHSTAENIFKGASQTCNIELLHIKTTNQHILNCERLSNFLGNLDNSHKTWCSCCVVATYGQKCERDFWLPRTLTWWYSRALQSPLERSVLLRSDVMMTVPRWRALSGAVEVGI